jgi:hypothetical protein
VNKKVLKIFDDIAYEGLVTNFDPITKFFKILYSDGDCEELSKKQLIKILVE